MRTEGSEGARSQPLSPSSSRVRSLRLEVVPKLSSLLLGHGQVGGPHGGGVLEHTGQTHREVHEQQSRTWFIRQIVTSKKGENVAGRDWSEGKVHTSELKVTLLKSEDESARTHTHTQPELIYILTETVCPGAVQDGKVREEFDVAMAETPLGCF